MLEVYIPKLIYFLNLSILEENYDILPLFETWLVSGVENSELFDSRFIAYCKDRNQLASPFESIRGLFSGCVIFYYSILYCLVIGIKNAINGVKCNYLNGNSHVILIDYFIQYMI